MDLNKLTNFEKENRDNILRIEELMETADDRKTIENFFQKQWDNLDYKNETRPVIVFSTPSQTGTDWFRLRVPLFNLWKKHADKYYIIYTDDINFNMLKFADIVVQHRAGAKHIMINDIIDNWPTGFKRPVIIHDVDDNEHNLPDSHPLKKMWIETGKDKMSMGQIVRADKITTTGRILKREFSKLTNQSKIDILPNAFRWSAKQWQKENEAKPIEAKNKVTVGWSGLTSHFPDLIKMLKPLKEVKKNLEEDAHFIISGMPIVDKINVKNPKTGQISQKDSPENKTYKYRLRKGFDSFPGYEKELGEENCTFQDVKGLENYGEFYHQYDINLAYLGEKSTFNRSKSAIKIIEGFAVGAISIWTNWGGYEDFLYNLPTDLKEVAEKHMASNNDEEFSKNILYWIHNDKERKVWSKKFQDYVLDEFNIEKVTDLRAEYFDKLLN
jgi:glycosyltransferase involved in cell wall biosynthesis